ncbi:MAG: hypothetical protein HY885_04335 [Deltaproteobacteria bacterium]|nr:hypothetical protein [Deltaproteobacteria bacterium]
MRRMGSGKTGDKLLFVEKPLIHLKGGHGVRVTDLLTRNWRAGDQKLAGGSPVSQKRKIFPMILNGL